MLFIILWNVSGELHNPKYITLGSNNPLLVRKAAFHSSPFLIYILLYPQIRFSLLKYLVFLSLMITSLIKGKWYLNKWTIKNNYSLPLILNIVETIGTKKLFTKLDLCWNYNKGSNEWKVGFTTLEGLLKPTVMFF